MATPFFSVAGSRNQSASATSLALTKPSVTSPDLIQIAIVQSKNNATHSTATSGWTKIDQQNNGASFTVSIWIAKGDAGSPTFTWTGAAACGGAISAYYSPEGPLSTTTGVIQFATGTGGNHTTSGVTTTKNNALVLGLEGENQNAGTSTPGSGWTRDSQQGSGTDNGGTLFFGKPVTTAGSSSGSLLFTAATNEWVQWQVEIFVVAAVGFEAAKEEVAIWLEPKDGFAGAALEAGVWLDPDGFNAAQLEVGVWLEPAPVVARRRQACVN